MKRHKSITIDRVLNANYRLLRIQLLQEMQEKKCHPLVIKQLVALTDDQFELWVTVTGGKSMFLT